MTNPTPTPVIRLEFGHAQFSIEDIDSISVEYVRSGPVGSGAIFLFSVKLMDGRLFQISPGNVIEPPGNTDPYFRDKDSSWSTLTSFANVLHDGCCRWYESDAVKHLSRHLGYPVKE